LTKIPQLEDHKQINKHKIIIIPHRAIKVFNSSYKADIFDENSITTDKTKWNTYLVCSMKQVTSAFLVRR